jgi:hypothetical protein
MTVERVVRPGQPCSRDDYKTSVELDSYLPDRWAAERLPLLDGIGPLLPGGADKRPLVGDGWPEHPGLSIDKLQAAAPECICWNVGADPGHIGIDIDGPAAAAFCQGHGCEPYAADTWRIIRTGNTERLKLVFTVTPEQKAALVAGGKTVKPGGQELAVFAKPGTQIVVLGNHYTKESKHTENDDQYAWAGRNPADAQPLPPEWFALLTGVFCGDRPLKPPTRRQVSAPSSRKANAYKSSGGGWGNSSSQHPCPVCGRDHSGACSISSGPGKPAVWCCHGETKSAPDCSKAGEIVPGADGQQWAYVRTEEHDSFGERSLFVLHEVKQGRTAKTVNSRSKPTITSTGIQAVLDARGFGWRPQKEGPPIRSKMAIGDFSGRLSSELGNRLGFDEVALMPAVDRVPLKDWEVSLLHGELSEAGWIIGSEAAEAGLLLAARRNPFHPVREYLKRVEADPAIAAFDLDQVAPRFFRAASALHKMMVRKWLIGAVARAMDPGCQMDYCLVLQSDIQGIGKTSELRELASPEWFTSTIPDQDKDWTLNVHCCWIFELAELESLTGAKAAGKIKNMLTTTTDLVRVPYGKVPERMKRPSVFCATVNKRVFLRDDTGNRRFWVVPIEGTEKLDRAGLAAARDGIWGMASERQNTYHGKRVRELAESLGWRHQQRRTKGGERKLGLWPGVATSATSATGVATGPNASEASASNGVATSATSKSEDQSLKTKKQEQQEQQERPSGDLCSFFEVAEVATRQNASDASGSGPVATHLPPTCRGCHPVATPDSEPEWHQKARLLRDANPDMAYNTVALHLDIDYGEKVTGRQVREVLEQDDPRAA